MKPDEQIKAPPDYSKLGWALRRVNEIAVSEFGVEVYKPKIKCPSCGATYYWPEVNYETERGGMYGDEDEEMITAKEPRNERECPCEELERV